MGTLRYIRDLLLRNKFRYVFGIIFLLGVDILQLVLPKILGDATDYFESGTLNASKLTEFAVIIALIAVGIAVLRFFFRYTLFGVSRSIELSLRNRFYAHLQKLSMTYFNTHKTGDIMAHATNDMNNVTMATGQGIIFAVDSALIPVVALVMMFNTAGFKLTAACFAPLIVLGIVVFFFMKIMQSTVQRQQETFSNLTETARENFSGIRVIKSFVQERKEIERFEHANKVNKEANLKFVRLMSMMFPSVMLVASVSFVIALWYGGILVIRDQLTLGGFVAFNSYLGMLIWPITALGWVANIFQRGGVSLNRINTIMDETPEIRDSAAKAGSEGAENASSTGKSTSGGSKPANSPALQGFSAEALNHPAIEGTIEFRELSFTYPGSDSPVLKNISVKVEKGKTLAIVGRTGSGKTTLANLIPHLLSVPERTLFIDGRDINEIPLSVLRGSIGSVPQDTFLFSDTIKENIDFYRGFSDREIEDASKTARLYDNIMEFPGGFGTMVGERGVTLSGGQKQRAAIARAVIGSPAILILDDCLSAVDAKTEEGILRDLKVLMRQRTSIIVSHRISAVKDADEIIVLDDGEIIERGTHDSLVGLGGYYSSLYTRQLLADEIEEAE
ncbi:MAG TPA: ABC transporter ATP-binding protein [Clostridia bacterium]|nr:ABC transporter ATP-binding protein [Clostridia bacterium]